MSIFVPLNQCDDSLHEKDGFGVQGFATKNIQRKHWKDSFWLRLISRDSFVKNTTSTVLYEVCCLYCQFRKGT